MTDLTQKIVWITGASSGIGRALSIRAAEAGCQIILSGRRQEALATLAASLPVESLILPFEAPTTIWRIPSRPPGSGGDAWMC